MSGRIGIGQRLYLGQVSVNFVGRRRTWYQLAPCCFVG